MAEHDDTLTTEEAAKLLKVSERTLEQWRVRDAGDDGPETLFPEGEIGGVDERDSPRWAKLLS